MSKAKIVFIGPVPPPYMGPTLATEIILNSELSERFNLIHLDTSDPRDIGKLGAIDFWNIYLALKHYCQLLWLILTRWPEIIYIPVSQKTIGYLRDAGFIIIGKLFRRKVVCHLRGGNFRRWYDSTGPGMQRVVRVVHGWVDGQIVLGDKLRPLFEGLVREDRIFVVPNGRDFVEFEGFRREQHSNDVTVLYLSNFCKMKGVLDVFNAIPLVLERCTNVRFVFAGGWLEPEVREEVQEKLRNHPKWPVTIIEKIYGDEKYDTLRKADIFVFPTYYPPEGHPWAIVEAMAAGLPVISTDQGAITESVIDGKTGFIVEKKSPKSVADKICELLDDRDKRSEMGREGRKRYEDILSENNLVDNFSYVFETMLSRD